MTAMQLAIDDVYEVNGSPCRVSHRATDGLIVFQNLETGASWTCSDQELASWISDGSACRLPLGIQKANQSVGKSPIDPHAANFSDLPKSMQQVALRAQGFVEAVIAGGHRKNQAVLKAVLPSIAQELGYEYVPHPATLCRWWRNYEKGGRDVRSLVPHFHERGRYKKRLQTVMGTTHRAIQTMFMTKQRLPQRKAYKEVCKEIRRQNASRSTDEGMLPIPSERTVNRIISRLDPYEVIRAREGKQAADKAYRWVKKGPIPTRPLELVEIDHSPADLYVVVDAEHKIVARPTLTVSMDRFSRMPLGFNAGFSETQGDVATCLYHSILDKSYIKQLFPALKSDWPCMGIPEMVISDQAAQFHSRGNTDLHKQLNMTVKYCGSHSPWLKGMIERFIGTTNGFCHTLPGTTFSNPQDRGDYDPKKHACILMEDFQFLLHKFFVDVYPHTIHEGLEDRPYDVWCKAVKQYPVRMPNSRNELVPLLGGYEERELTRSGVRIHKLFYNSEECERIRRHPDFRDGEKVKVRFDPDHLGEVWILNPITKAYVAIPSTDPKYTNERSMYQHDVVRRRKRENVKLGRPEGSDAEIHAELMEEIEAAKANGKKQMRIQNRLARFEKRGGKRFADMAPQNQAPAPIDVTVIAPKRNDPAPDASRTETSNVRLRTGIRVTVLGKR